MYLPQLRLVRHSLATMPHFPEVGRLPLQPKWIFPKSVSSVFCSQLTSSYSFLLPCPLPGIPSGKEWSRRMNYPEPNAGDNRHQSATAPNSLPLSSFLQLPPFSLQHQLVHALNLNEQYTEGFSTCHVKPQESLDNLICLNYLGSRSSQTFLCSLSVPTPLSDSPLSSFAFRLSTCFSSSVWGTAV